MRRTPARRALTLTATVAGTLLLAGCGGDQPLPKVTVHDGTFSAAITPSTYCVDSTHCRSTKNVDLPVVPAHAGDRIRIDVPQQVEHNGWAIAALSLDGAMALAASGALVKQSSFQVAANTNGGNPFIVQVRQLRNGKPDASIWSFVVHVAAAK